MSYLKLFRNLLMACTPVEPPSLAATDKEWNCTEEDEHYITRHAEPAYQAHGVIGDIFYRTGMPVAVVDYIPKLYESGREETEHNHHCKAYVQAPER